jgi:hypothetical protein
MSEVVLMATMMIKSKNNYTSLCHFVDFFEAVLLETSLMDTSLLLIGILSETESHLKPQDGKPNKLAQSIVNEY